MWNNFRPEELATPEAFARDPRLVWQWYGWRRELIARCRPNAGHMALARWMPRHDGVTLVTQNVDGLHERAAEDAASDDPIRLHGSIFRTRCTVCQVESGHWQPVDASNEDTLPKCGACGGLLRPAVVWFGEQLPTDALSQAGNAARQAEVCLVIGTSGTVYPAAGLAFEAVDTGARLIVVDPGDTAFDAAASIRLKGSAADVLPTVLGGLGAGS
jgi:NAD-dependent deacetylase